MEIMHFQKLNFPGNISTSGTVFHNWDRLRELSKLIFLTVAFALRQPDSYNTTYTLWRVIDPLYWD